MLTVKEFYEWEKASRDTIDLKRCYIDIAGDLVSGVLLSQIIYWFLPGESGQKLRIEKEGRLWLAKGRTEWWDECRISPKQFDRAIQVLKARNLVEIKRFRFRGSPTIHIYLNMETLLEWVNSIFTKGEITDSSEVNLSNRPKGELEVAEKGESLTESTPETNIQKTTPRDNGDKPHPSSQVKEVLIAMQAYFGYPDKTDIDPIPNYGKEGKAIKRMIARGFNIVQIVDCWMAKCKSRGQFVTMVYVNEDIESAPAQSIKAESKYENRSYLITKIYREQSKTLGRDLDGGERDKIGRHVDQGLKDGKSEAEILQAAKVI